MALLSDRLNNTALDSMLPRLALLLLAGVLASVIAYWVVQIAAPRSPVAPAGAIGDARDGLDLQLAGQLFGLPGGAAPAAGRTNSNIQVVGVAAGPPTASAVLIVDGKPPKAFAIGDEVSAGMKLVEVRIDAAVFDRGGVRSEAPAPLRPSIAVLTSGPQQPGAANSAAPVPTGGMPGAASSPPPGGMSSPPPISSPGQAAAQAAAAAHAAAQAAGAMAIPPTAVMPTVPPPGGSAIVPALPGQPAGAPPQPGGPAN